MGSEVFGASVGSEVYGASVVSGLVHWCLENLWGQKLVCQYREKLRDDQLEQNVLELQ